MFKTVTVCSIKKNSFFNIFCIILQHSHYFKQISVKEKQKQEPGQDKMRCAIRKRLPLHAQLNRSPTTVSLI